MKKLIVGAMALSGAATVLLGAEAAAQEPAYVSLSAGIVNLRDAELEYEDNADRDRFASFDNGYAVAGAFGRGVGQNFRLEGEIAYRSNDEAFIMPGGGGEGAATSLAFMGNAYWDAPVAWRVRPYVGFGLGAANVTHEGFAIDAADETRTTLVDDSGWGFAYQAMVGARAPIGEQWLVGAEYRYFSVAEPKIDDADSFTYDTDYDSHALMFSLARRL